MLTVNSATPSDELIEIIQARNLDNYFRVILGSPKTKLENLEQTLEAMKCNVAESIFLEMPILIFMRLSQSVWISLAGKSIQGLLIRSFNCFIGRFC